MIKLNKNQKFLISEMVKDEKSYNKILYSAGPYWNYKTKKILYCLEKDGIENFRGLYSGVGSGYADNLILDYRNELGFKGRIASLFTRLPYIKKIYDGQIHYSASILDSFIKTNAKNFISNEKVQSLIKKYNIENSTEFGCVLKFKYVEKEYSCHYLNLCNRLDIIDSFINYKNVNTFFEIGGGFGAYTHLLISNFNNIKKVIYMDMAPNLFVGTEYLRSFYGKAVKDYVDLKKKEKITFNNNQDLEILCIAPWQIEKINIGIDHFHNAASFQEMSEKAVKNYAKYIHKFIKNNSSISLYCYDSYDLNKTINPNVLNEIFNSSLSIKKFPNLYDENKTDYYLFSKN